MNEKAAAARRAYKRAWARANPDKIKAQQERYWSRKAKEIEAAREQREPASLTAAPAAAE